MIEGARMRRAFLLAIALVVLSACAPRPSRTIVPLPSTTGQPTGASCGEVTDLTPNSAFGGYGLARAGPLWFSAFGQIRAGKAIIVDFVAGLPTKVLIHPDPALLTPVRLVGTECATGAPLRFCYGQGTCGFTGSPVPIGELATKGVPIQVVDPSGGDDAGYMLFPRPGTYQLSVLDGGGVLGRVVLLVR